MGGSEVGVMRSLVLASVIFAAAPAMAQEIYCEGVAASDHGDVIAGFDLEPNGTIKSRSISWMPTRDAYNSAESTFLRAPRLVLYFREKEDGDVLGPTGANVAYTQYSVPGTNRGLSPSQVTIEATAAPSGKQASWKASEAAKGEPQLAQLLRENKSDRLTIRLMGPDRKTAVSAEFDLTKQDEVRKLLPQAKEKGEREVANFKRLVSEGKKLDSCPAL
jgi:hypothetical protein